LFYFAAVAIVGGALGYALAVGLLQAIGLNFGFVVWLVGLIVGVIFAVGVLVLNIQKLVVMAATAILGAGVIVGCFLFLFGGPANQVIQNPVRLALQASPWWTLAFLILAVFGFIAQYQTTKQFEIGVYDRSDELVGGGPQDSGSGTSSAATA
jgi:hypothetical protein